MVGNMENITNFTQVRKQRMSAHPLNQRQLKLRDSSHQLSAEA